jgi:dienelactone hydrolase
MSIQTRHIRYDHEGTTFEGMLAWDDALAGPRPAVAVSHTWAGRGGFEESRAMALAGLGYVGFALDLYGAGILGSNPQENAALMTPLMQDRALLQGRIGRGIDVLREQPEVDAQRVAAIGYCFGGLCVLDLARSGCDVKGVVSFHGLFDPPGNTAGTGISARALCLHGYDDPMVKPQLILQLADELTAAGADWQIHAYGNTVHAFTNPEANNPEMGTIYSALADGRSWASLQNFLVEIFS